MPPLLPSDPPGKKHRLPLLLSVLGGLLLLFLLVLLLTRAGGRFLATNVTPPSVRPFSLPSSPAPHPPIPPLPQTLPTRAELELLTHDLRALQRSNAHAHLAERAEYRTRRLAQALAATYDDSLVEGLLLSETELQAFPSAVRPLLEQPHTTLAGTVGEGVIDGLKPEDSRDLFMLHVEPTHELVLLVGTELQSPKIPGAHVTVTGTKVGNILLVEGGFQDIQAPSPTTQGMVGDRNPLATLLQRVITTAEAYVLSGYKWGNPNISASYMPDGTLTDGYTSRLFVELNAVAPTPTWQREFARTLQTWAEYANINFHVVPDDGSPKGTLGQVQGDPRFGDIRLGSRPMSTTILGFAHFPAGTGYGSTEDGDITLNADSTWAIGANYDLYTVLLHESGHALGLDHSTAGTAMYAYTGVRTELSADDIAGIQAIYGPRKQDVYDTAASNDAFTSATSVPLDSAGKASLQADLTTLSDLDHYRVTAPSSFDGTLSVSVDARVKSLLTPKIAVSTTTGTLLGTVNAPTYGSVATLSLTGLSPSQSVVLHADGATSDVFGMGAYLLNVQFGGVTSILPPPSALTATASAPTVVTLAWTDNATDETGYQVERSLDGGSTWSLLQSLAANSTTTQDTTVAAGTTYNYRIRAVRDATLSTPSNTATLTLVPAIPTGLTATVLSSSQITLTWGDVQGETGYTLERTLDGSTWIQIGAVGVNTTTYQDSGLTPSTTYTYRVKAYNQGGSSSPSTTVSATTLSSSSPSPLSSPSPSPSASPLPSPSPSSSPVPSPSPTVSTDTTKPTVSITFPLTGSTVPRNTTVTIQASASDNVGISQVQVFVSGTLKCTDTTAPYTCAWKVPAAKNKPYTLTAQARDPSGNQGTSAPVSVTGR